MFSDHTYSKSVCCSCAIFYEKKGIKCVEKLFDFINPITSKARPTQNRARKRQLKPKISPVVHIPERIQLVRQCRLKSIDQNKEPQEIRARRITIDLPSKQTPPPPTSTGGAIPKIPLTQSVGAAKQIQHQRATTHYFSYGNRDCSAGSTTISEVRAAIRSPLA